MNDRTPKLHPGEITSQFLERSSDEANRPRKLLRCAPFIIRTLGSYAQGVARHFNTKLTLAFGQKPGHIGLLAIDTTHQPHLEEVEPLPPECFLNLGHLEQIQARIGGAREDPHVAEYMPEAVTRLAAGLGAGGFPAAARFLYEQNVADVIQRIGALLDPYTPAKRPAMANAVNRHPLLRSMNMIVTPSGPLRVVYVAGTTGGTVAALMYDVVLFKYVMRQLGIEGSLTLLLTLPATGASDRVESERKRQMFFGRLQELTDLNDGQALTWPIGGQILSERGPFFDSIFLLPEPTAERLQEHQRFASDLLLQWISPLGAAVASRAVDMVHVYTAKGPHGQKKYLSLIGMATVEATAYPDVAAYAEASLGRSAVVVRKVSDASVAVANLLERNKLTTSTLTAPPLTLSKVAIPPDLEGDPGPFLEYAESKTRAEAQAQAKDFGLAWKRQCDHVLNQGRELLHRAGVEAGVASAVLVGNVLSKSMRALEVTAAQWQSRRVREEVQARSDEVQDQLAARQEIQRARAHAEFLSLAIESLRKLAAAVDRLVANLQVTADVFKELGIDYDQWHESFLLQRPPAHAFLDREALDALIHSAEPACTREIRELAVRSLEARVDPAQIKADVKATVVRHALPFAKFGDVDEALRASGERGPIVLENAAAAAEPSVRTDARWDPRIHSVRHAYPTAPEFHPINEIVRRQGRTVFPTAFGSSSPRMTIVTVDYGLEPAALVVTRESLQAHVASTSENPPYADRNYKPSTDVMVPSPTEVFAYLAIPVHEHLGGGVIRYDELDGYVYSNESIGGDRVAATAALLERSGRKPFLPNFEDLCRQTKAALHKAGGNDRTRVVEILRQIEAKLDQHIALAGPAEKQILMLERAAARAVRIDHEDKIRQHEAHAVVWAQPARNTSPLSSRIMSREPSDDGASAQQNHA